MKHINTINILVLFSILVGFSTNTMDPRKQKPLRLVINNTTQYPVNFFYIVQGKQQEIKIAPNAKKSFQNVRNWDSAYYQSVPKTRFGTGVLPKHNLALDRAKQLGGNLEVKIDQYPVTGRFWTLQWVAAPQGKVRVAISRREQLLKETGKIKEQVTGATQKGVTAVKGAVRLPGTIQAYKQFKQEVQGVIVPEYNLMQQYRNQMQTDSGKMYVLAKFVEKLPEYFNKTKEFINIVNKNYVALKNKDLTRQVSELMNILPDWVNSLAYKGEIIVKNMQVDPQDKKRAQDFETKLEGWVIIGKQPSKKVAPVDEQEEEQILSILQQFVVGMQVLGQKISESKAAQLAGKIKKGVAIGARVKPMKKDIKALIQDIKEDLKKWNRTLVTLQSKAAKAYLGGHVYLQEIENTTGILNFIQGIAAVMEEQKTGFEKGAYTLFNGVYNIIQFMQKDLTKIVKEGVRFIVQDPQFKQDDVDVLKKAGIKVDPVIQKRLIVKNLNNSERRIKAKLEEIEDKYEAKRDIDTIAAEYKKEIAFVSQLIEKALSQETEAELNPIIIKLFKRMSYTPKKTREEKIGKIFNTYVDQIKKVDFGTQLSRKRINGLSLVAKSVDNALRAVQEK